LKTFTLPPSFCCALKYIFLASQLPEHQDVLGQLSKAWSTSHVSIHLHDLDRELQHCFSALSAQLPSDSPPYIGPSVTQSHLASGLPVTCFTDCCVACLQEQVEYLDDSEVDFSSDDDEEDMEDFEGGDDERIAAGQRQLGKRPAGMHSFHPKNAWLCLSGAKRSPHCRNRSFLSPGISECTFPQQSARF